MMSAMRQFGLAAAVIGLMAGAAGQAKADVLLDLEDPPGQINTVFSFSLTALGSSTTVTFAGYQPPFNESVTHIGLFLGGAGPNLLGSTWSFTPAPSRSSSGTFNDGTSVPALSFAGFTEDSFDTYSQTISTAAGLSYTLNFLFTNATNSVPSGLVVSTSGSASAVPEPSSLALALTGTAVLLVVGYARSPRKRALPA
jgi:hypothetical protein